MPDKPEDIKHSMKTGNVDHLRAAQRKSVEARLRNQAEQAQLAALADAIAAEEHRLMLKDAAAAELLHQEGEEALRAALKRHT